MWLEVNHSPEAAKTPTLFINNPINQSRVAFPRYVAFKQQPDSFEKASDFSKYASEEAITTMIKRNPKLREMMAELQIPEQVNMGSLYALKRSHLKETKKVVEGIIKNLPQDLRAQVDYGAIIRAAELHDFGKVLIPRNILNKDGKLNTTERKIMEQHSTLGFELLSTTDLDEETLHLIKYHHQNPVKTGYPMAEADFNFDINAQILSLADKYAAFREDRSYKKGLNQVNSVRMVKKEVAKLGYDPEVFKALANFAQQDYIVKKAPAKMPLQEYMAMKAQATKADPELVA